MEFKHISVLPLECMEALDIKPCGTYVDATTGAGGHSLMIAERLSEKGRLFCFDRDEEALAAAKERLKDHLRKVTFIKSNFADMKQRLSEQGVSGVDGILFDLGVSSYQLDNKDRGFSYMHDARLDMRMDRSESFSAYDVINTYSEEQLSEIFFKYGEERYSKRIAQNIVKARQERPVETTFELVDIIKASMPSAAKKEKQHPAKRVFQAVRIEVNRELSSVEEAVENGIEILNSGGRIAVISFHSLEDRLVKLLFQQAESPCTCPKDFPVCVCGKKPIVKIINKKVITASEKELEENPRSRSAKLRVAEKL